MANNNFYEDLNGETYFSLLKKIYNLDRHVTSYDDRLAATQEILYSTNYFTDYFSDYYNPNVKTDDSLSQSNSVGRLLDMLADYLLGAEDIQPEQATNKHFIGLDLNMKEPAQPKPVIKLSYTLDTRKENA